MSQNYQQIKQNMTQVNLLVGEGKLADAHALVVESTKLGLTAHDMQLLLDPSTLKQLRSYARSLTR